MSEIIEFPGEWVGASFPATHSYVGKFTIQTSQSITESAERDVYRHLVDKSAQGRWVFIPDGVSEEEASAFEVSPVTAREAAMKPRAGQSASSKQRYLLGLIFDELGGGSTNQREAFYQDRMEANRKKLSDELEAIRRDKHYAGRA